MTPDVITSTSNPLVKELASLATRRARDRTGTVLVEGHREVSRAVAAGCEIDLVVACPNLVGDRPIPIADGARVQLLGETAFRKISRRQGPDGVAARTTIPSLDLDDLEVPAAPVMLVVEAIEKPGNLGAMLRTAAGLGVHAVVVCDPITDVYNPNVIRSSQGALFDMQLAVATAAETLGWLQRRGIAVVAGVAAGGVAPWQIEPADGVAIVIGSESDGLTPTWRSATKEVTIPLVDSSGVDSLNAATAAALLLYEAVRRRHTAP